MVDIGMGILGLFITVVGIIVGNATGAGAGGFVVPALYICFSIDLASTVALWNASTLITAGYRVINSCLRKEKNPDNGRPIIDFNSVLIFQPLLFMGIEIGFIVMDLVGEGIKIIIFSMLLFAMAGFSLTKALKRRRMDIEKKKKALAESLTKKNAIEGHGISVFSTQAHKNSMAIDLNVQRGIDPGVVQKVIDADNSYFPIKKIALSMSSVILLIACHLIIGSPKSKSFCDIQTCSTAYWIGLSAYLLSLLAILIISYHVIKKEDEEKKRLDLTHLLSNIEWTPTLIINICILAAVSGFFSGSYGIGGAIILNMILLSKNTNPEVVTSTTMLCLLYICLATTIVYIANGKIIFQPFEIALLAITLPLTYVSYMWLKRIFAQYSSVILFMLVGALGVSGALVPIFGFTKLYLIEGKHDVWTGASMCK